MAGTSGQKTGWMAAITATLFIFTLATDQITMPLATSSIIQELKTDTGQGQVALALVSLFAAPLYIASGKLGCPLRHGMLPTPNCSRLLIRSPISNLA